MSKEKETPYDLIVKTIKEKSVLKQDVYKQTLNAFNELRGVLKEVATDLKTKAAAIDKRIVIDFKDKGEFEFEVRVAGDLLLFHMHSNIFDFDKSHQIWKTSYVRDNHFRSFCGMIGIYNFLTDSFKYNRGNDVGYMVGRIFVNKESHYFVEGKRQLGFLYNDFVHATIDKVALRAIAESTILYCLNFDLLTPPFDQVKEILVAEMLEASNNMQIKTGKRLGFRFQADTDQID